MTCRAYCGAGDRFEFGWGTGVSLAREPSLFTSIAYVVIGICIGIRCWVVGVGTGDRFEFGWGTGLSLPSEPSLFILIRQNWYKLV